MRNGASREPAGLWPALLTPFTADGSLDPAAPGRVLTVRDVLLVHAPLAATAWARTRTGEK